MTLKPFSTQLRIGPSRIGQGVLESGQLVILFWQLWIGEVWYVQLGTLDQSRQ